MGEFVMPTLGADMSAGTLIAWCKQPGDTVARGDIIAEVHTDKADIEVEVFVSGVIEKLLVEPGQQVPVGTPLALIRENGKAPAAAPGPEPAAPAAEHARLLVSPSAKSLAEELGVDLSAIHGTGPGGRIQRRRPRLPLRRRPPRRQRTGRPRCGARSRRRWRARSGKRRTST